MTANLVLRATTDVDDGRPRSGESIASLVESVRKYIAHAKAKSTRSAYLASLPA